MPCPSTCRGRMGKSGCVLSSTWIRLFSSINYGRPLGRSEKKQAISLGDTPIAAAINGCVITLSRGNTI